MSGIVGILNLDCAPVDRRLLTRMTEFLAFRGPDAQRIRIDGAVGFGHALLRTTDESEDEHQPLTFDEEVCVVADARIDVRGDLIAKLKSHGHEVTSDASDVELVLRSYSVWGESCVEHLLGDFAFGIWDARRRRLFCARDQMGIKPFYYAALGHCIVFSNTLDCLRLHPSLSDRLNDNAIADFLLFNLNQNKATTTFADIQRLPPAHCATWSGSDLRLRRYWTLPIDEPIHYRRRDDYVDRFKDLLQTVVGDRLRTNRVGIFMGGGLDSTTLAASAYDLLSRRSDDSELCAFTTYYQGYEKEGEFADLVAKSLGIPIRFRGLNSDGASLNWYDSAFHTPEPIPYPTNLAEETADFREMSSYSRVALYGEGPDNALSYEWRSHIHYLIQHKYWKRLLFDLSNHALLHRRVPLVSSIPGTIRRWLAKRDSYAVPPFPDWFKPDFENSLQLRARWDQYWRDPNSAHPVRPRGYASFDLPLWQAIFESFDAAQTRSPLEVRYPFLDLRMMRFLLAVPAIPWCRSKYLLRKAMRGVLPEPVLRRPKTPVLRDRWIERVTQCGLPPLDPSGTLGRYIDTQRLRPGAVRSPASFWIDFRARSLNYWLRNCDLLDKPDTEEDSKWDVRISAK
jgi:asparagine synthase (glutamine-hydrolysing)